MHFLVHGTAIDSDLIVLVIKSVDKFGHTMVK
jgi:hypothetical protein